MSNQYPSRFEKEVTTKFNVYNSLFLNLPYRSVNNIGTLIPLLFLECKEGLADGKNPSDILDTFFRKHTELRSEKERIDFMFRVIQYVERQVVLYDSVEDAAFKELHTDDTKFEISDYLKMDSLSDSRKEIVEWLKEFSVRIVFTAHPTQFYSPSVLDIIEELRRLIPKNNIGDIDVSLQQLGLTSLINSKKPTPIDEAKNIIYYLRNVYYDAVGEFYSKLSSHFSENEIDNHNIVKLGFWPCGDRDGNPFVTAESTRKVANELRTTLMKCYYNDVKGLQKKLSFRGVEDLIKQLRENLYYTMFDSDRVLVYENLMEPLLEIRKVIKEEYHGLYLEDLNKFINKVAIFKTHFASLDIRQDHSVHQKAIQSILIKEGLIDKSIDELASEELVNILLHAPIDAQGKDFGDDLINDTIVNIAQLKDIQSRNGEEGCHRYIISNSEDKYAVLYVLALFRWSGWKLDEITFDIVPLFETMIGMKDSEDTMNQLFALPEYSDHISRRNMNQTIMLGFSDGTKDGGYFKANWSIYKTKERLSAICGGHGVRALFFDGRGGPPSRGGGKSHRFYAAQNQAIANNEIQLTIQGQTITSNYGTQEQFNYNCEHLITAGLSKKCFPGRNELTEGNRAILERLSDLSFDKYNALKYHPRFMEYLEHKSTLKYYGRANIGSRPGKRGNKAKLELTDLRAISFVGSWSQLKQNVPGYFGTGSAIKALVDEGLLDELRDLFKDVPLFKALCLNSMMSLSKTNFELTGYMADDPVFGDFWRILEAEYILSKEMMLLVSGFDSLMEEEPISKASIAIREKIVLPLLVIQQSALQAVQKEGEYVADYEKIITRSLYGNINASRNSA